MQVKPCRTCPHRQENAHTVYMVWGEIPTPGSEVAKVIGEPHACHYSLDEDGNETLDSYPCVGWPETLTAPYEGRTMLKIYLLTQKQNRGWDTYDSCVVVAASPEEARLMHPRGDRSWNGNGWAYTDGTDPSTWRASEAGWAWHPDNVKAEEIGVTLADTAPKVVCASFNAG